MHSRSSVPFLLLLVLSLLPTFAAGQADPHPRSPELAMGATITALDVAGTSAGVAAGIADPGGRSTFNTDSNVWSLWDPQGGLVRTDDGDKANCQTDLLDNCQGDVVAVGVSDDGSRLAVAVRDRNEMAGRIVFITANQGVVRREEIPEAPTSLVMSGDGSRVVVGTLVDNGVQPDLGAVRMYSWTAGSGTSPGTIASIYRNETLEGITAVAIGESGGATRVSAAATGSHYRFTSGGIGLRHDTASTIVSVAYAASTAKHWSVAGAADGGVLLYSDDSDGATVATYDLRPGTQSQNAVAIAPDGTFFLAADAEGKVRLFRNPDLLGGTATTLVATSSILTGPARDIELSADGKYLAVAAGTSSALFRVAADRLDLVWQQSGTLAVNAVGINRDGTVVVAAAGPNATVFTTTRSINVTQPSSTPVVEPGHGVNFTVTYRNTGNREETVPVEVAFPAGWTGQVSPASLVLAPAESKTVTVTANAPGSALAGTIDVTLTHRLQGIPLQTPVAVRVSQLRDWTLETDDAPNQDIDAGESIQFTFRARNVGNAADSTEVLLTLDDPSWTASAVPTNLTVPRNGDATIAVTLRAPANAGELDSAKLTVRLAADSGASLTVGATVGARFGLTASAPSGSAFTTEPGQTLLVTVRATNTGNTADTFTVSVGNIPAGWGVTYPDGSDRIENVAAGASGDLRLQVQVPATAVAGIQPLAAVVTSLGDSTQKATVPLSIQVEEAPEEPKGKGKGSPGPGLALLVAALALAAVGARRLR